MKNIIKNLLIFLFPNTCKLIFHDGVKYACSEIRATIKQYKESYDDSTAEDEIIDIGILNPTQEEVINPLVSKDFISDIEYESIEEPLPNFVYPCKVFDKVHIFSHRGVFIVADITSTGFVVTNEQFYNEYLLRLRDNSYQYFDWKNFKCIDTSNQLLKPRKVLQLN